MSDFRCDENWTAGVKESVIDPMLVPLIIELGQIAQRVLQSTTPDENFSAVLDLCRKSRSIRMHVGNLSRMEEKAKEIVSEVLECALGGVLPAVQIDDDNRTEFEHAVNNIRKRLKLIQTEQPAILV